MKLFRSASLGDWAAAFTMLGLIALFIMRSSNVAGEALAGVKENESSIKSIEIKLEQVEDSVMTLGIQNSQEHKALRKTTEDTYKIVKLLAEKDGIVVP